MITAEQLNNQLDSTRWPRLNRVATEDSTVEIDLSVPEDLVYFKGHFPQQAVLPGVVQVHWAGELAQRFFSVDGFSELRSVKFNSMILPNQRASLTLKYSAEKRSVRFDYSSADEKFSSGVLAFSEHQS